MDMQSHEYVRFRREARNLQSGTDIVLEDGQPASVTAVDFTTVPGRRPYECGISAIGIFDHREYRFNVLKKKKFSIPRVVRTEACHLTGIANGVATVMKDGNTYVANLPVNDQFRDWLIGRVDEGDRSVWVSCISSMGVNKIIG